MPPHSPRPGGFATSARKRSSCTAAPEGPPPSRGTRWSRPGRSPSAKRIRRDAETSSMPVTSMHVSGATLSRPPCVSPTRAPPCIFRTDRDRILRSRRCDGSWRPDPPRPREIFTFTHLPPGPPFICADSLAEGMALASAPHPSPVSPEAWAMLGRTDLEAYTCWDFPTQSDREIEAGDAAFNGVTPARCAVNLVRRYTKAGQLVVDPMAGSGTVGSVARALGRRAVMFDLVPRHSSIVRADARAWPVPDEVATLAVAGPNLVPRSAILRGDGPSRRGGPKGPPSRWRPGVDHRRRVSRRPVHPGRVPPPRPADGRLRAHRYRHPGPASRSVRVPHVGAPCSPIQFLPSRIQVPLHPAETRWVVGRVKHGQVRRVGSWDIEGDCGGVARPSPDGRGPPRRPGRGARGGELDFVAKPKTEPRLRGDPIAARPDPDIHPPGPEGTPGRWGHGPGGSADARMGMVPLPSRSLLSEAGRTGSPPDRPILRASGPRRERRSPPAEKEAHPSPLIALA